jgi:hypothetical protein
MTITDFADPGAPGGDKLPLADLNGRLIMIEVHEALTGVATSFGVSDPVRCDVHVLDGDAKGEVYSDSLIFPKVLCGQLRSQVGGKVLGRLGQGVAKPGQSAPWVINAATDDEKVTGRKYLAHLATVAPVVADDGEPF